MPIETDLCVISIDKLSICTRRAHPEITNEMVSNLVLIPSGCGVARDLPRETREKTCAKALDYLLETSEFMLTLWTFSSDTRDSVRVEPGQDKLSHLGKSQFGIEEMKLYYHRFHVILVRCERGT